MPDPSRRQYGFGHGVRFGMVEVTLATSFATDRGPATYYTAKCNCGWNGPDRRGYGDDGRARARDRAVTDLVRHATDMRRKATR